MGDWNAATREGAFRHLTSGLGTPVSCAISRYDGDEREWDEVERIELDAFAIQRPNLDNLTQQPAVRRLGGRDNANIPHNRRQRYQLSSFHQRNRFKRAGLYK